MIRTKHHSVYPCLHSANQSLGLLSAQTLSGNWEHMTLETVQDGDQVTVTDIDIPDKNIQSNTGGQWGQVIRWNQGEVFITQGQLW